MRRPAERLPQRRLVYEIRMLVDRGRVEEARSLLAEHPRACRSAHVRHNVGRARARALAGYDGARSLLGEPKWMSEMITGIWPE